MMLGSAAEVPSKVSLIRGEPVWAAAVQPVETVTRPPMTRAIATAILGTLEGIWRARRPIMTYLGQAEEPGATGFASPLPTRSTLPRRPHD